MAPSFLKDLRRRSKASFRPERHPERANTERTNTDRTDHSNDTSSDGAGSQGTAPSSGSVTPPSIHQQSDPALNLQVKDPVQLREQLRQTSPNRLSMAPRPPLSSSSSRLSVSGMSGLGAPSSSGNQNLPVSPYAPKISNLSENAWVRY